MEVLKSFGISLGLTLLIEMSLAFIFRVRTRRGLTVVLLANVLTNPVLVCLCMVFGAYLGKWYYPFQLLLEIPVVIVEGRIYRDFRKDLAALLSPFLLSLVLNTCSYGTGLIITQLL